MSITTEEELAFRLLSLFYFYFWPLPFKWEYSNSKIIVPNSITRNIPFIAMIFVIWSYGMGTFFETLYMGSTASSKDFPRVNIIVHGTICVITLIFCICLYKSFRSLKAFVSVLNETLEITDRLRNGKTIILKN